VQKQYGTQNARVSSKTTDIENGKFHIHINFWYRFNNGWL